MQPPTKAAQRSPAFSRSSSLEPSATSAIATVLVGAALFAVGCGASDSTPGDMGGSTGGSVGSGGASSPLGSAGKGGGVAMGSGGSGGYPSSGQGGSGQAGGSSFAGSSFGGFPGAAGATGQGGGPTGSGGQPGAGGSGQAGMAGTGTGAGGGGAGGGGGVAPGPSGLPAPPGGSNVPKPTGTPGNLTVLNWAGFKGAVTYSFDDDNTSQIQNYSTLEALGVPFTFFLWTGKAEASNSIWATAVKDGHEIGNHTMSHDSSGHCTLADINSATQFIQSKLGVKAWTMAAPNGATCYEQYAKGVFFINRGVQPAQPVLPNGNSDPTNLNCYIPAQGQQASVFNSNVDDGHSKGGWVIYVVHGFTGDGAAYQPVDLAQLTTAIKYTKSLGDMWIGTMQNVASYWLGQKAFTAAMTSTSGSSKTYTWTLPGQFPTGKYLRVKVDGGTVTQKGATLSWDPHGYYEIALDAGSVTVGP